MLYKIPLVFDPQPEGGYTVTCPLLPELLTEGDTMDEALFSVRDALLAVVEMYRDLGLTLPATIVQASTSEPVWLETMVTLP